MTQGGFGRGPQYPYGNDPYGGNAFGPPVLPAPPPSPPPPVNTLATLSVVFAFVFAPVGAVLGHLGLSQIARTGERGRDRALVGLTLSYAITVFAVVALVVWGISASNNDTPVASPAPTSSTSTSSAAPTTRATFAPAAPLPSAQSLLLPSGTTTPRGPAMPAPSGLDYFTSADPAECAAAVLFENSPLLPPASRDHAEMGYIVDQTSTMSESADTYFNDLDRAKLVHNGFTAVSGCTGPATGRSVNSSMPGLRLTSFSMAGDGVLVWEMSQPAWTCAYGMAATAHAVMMLSFCSEQPGFPMADWANHRRAEILSHTS